MPPGLVSILILGGCMVGVLLLAPLLAAWEREAARRSGRPWPSDKAWPAE
jgi:hypothetical protein